MSHVTYEQAKAEGRCVNCTQRALPGYVRCAKHRAMLRAGLKQRYEQAKQHGHCPRCPNTPRPGYVYCLACLQKLARQAEVRRGKARRNEGNAREREAEPRTIAGEKT